MANTARNATTVPTTTSVMAMPRRRTGSSAASTASVVSAASVVPAAPVVSAALVVSAASGASGASGAVGSSVIGSPFVGSGGGGRGGGAGDARHAVRPRPEGPHLVGPGPHDERRRLRDLEPRAGEVHQWLGDDDAVLVAEDLQARVLGVQAADGVGLRRSEQRPRLPFGGVADG